MAIWMCNSWKACSLKNLVPNVRDKMSAFYLALAMLIRMRHGITDDVGAR